MAYEPRYEISTKQEIILGPQFLNLALKALVKNHQTNIFETKIIVFLKFKVYFRTILQYKTKTIQETINRNTKIIDSRYKSTIDM